MEPSEQARSYLDERGYKVYATLESLQNEVAREERFNLIIRFLCRTHPGSVDFCTVDVWPSSTGGEYRFRNPVRSGSSNRVL